MHLKLEILSLKLQKLGITFCTSQKQNYLFHNSFSLFVTTTMSSFFFQEKTCKAEFSLTCLFLLFCNFFLLFLLLQPLINLYKRVRIQFITSCHEIDGKENSFFLTRIHFLTLTMVQEKGCLLKKERCKALTYSLALFNRKRNEKNPRANVCQNQPLALTGSTLLARYQA